MSTGWKRVLIDDLGFDKYVPKKQLEFPELKKEDLFSRIKNAVLKHSASRASTGPLASKGDKNGSQSK